MNGYSWRRTIASLLRMISGNMKPRGLRSRDGRHTHLNAEQLERREMLAADQITFLPANSQVYIEGSSVADQVQIWSESGHLRVRMENAFGVEDKTFDLSDVTSIHFLGNDGDDRFVNSSDVTSSALGGDGNDTLIGGAGADQLLGGAGDDTLEGQAGSDSLQGGAGNDTLFGGDDNDELIGDIGADWLYGGSGSDSIFGHAGKDYLHGGVGDDVLYGGDDDDQLLGDSGADMLYGEHGNDVLQGHAGADYLHGGFGNDMLCGGDDDDELLGGVGDDELRGQSGDDLLYGHAGADYLHGGAGADRIYGGDDDDQMLGDIGADSLFGEGGNDTLLGHAGTDVLDGGFGDDVLLGGSENDQLIGDLGADGLWGQSGDDTLNGHAGRDYLHGGVGNDLLYGGDDEDELLGDTGADELYGQDGDDILKGHGENDYLDGGWGHDRIDGGEGDDQLLGGVGDDRLDGAEGNDLLQGHDGNDDLYGASGDDGLQGGSENDRLFGGAGADELDGQSGDDFLSGDSENDDLNGGIGNDRIYGGDGDDLLIGDTGADEMYGEGGNDSLQGHAGDNLLIGGAGNDTLMGGDDQDVVVGGGGVDNINGGIGNDVLIGGAEADTVVGYFGDDIMIGGSTVYDLNADMLSDLAAAWAQPMPYSDRIALLKSDTFSAPLTIGETVLDDAVADTLTGGDGQDWFIQTGLMQVYVPSDVHHHDDSDHSTWKQGFGTSGPNGDTNNDGLVDAADYVMWRKLGGSGGQSHDHADDHHGHGGAVVDHPPALEGFDLVSAIDHFDRSSAEAIHSALPHADSPVLQREHLSLFQLVRYDEVTHYAIHDGDWLNPATWHDGIVPTAGARVLIPMNVTVTVNGIVTPRLDTIRIDGTLSFDVSTNTELRVDTVVVGGSGAFEMGTEEAPIQSGVKARLFITNDGPIDRVADPFGLGRGLLSHGRVSIHGAEVTGHVALLWGAIAGQTVLNLKSVPIGWKVGDTIVIASTSVGATENEVRTIVAINGTNVQLNQSLSYSHIPARADFEVHVANVSRNAVIESESSVVDRRGHVMFMHNRDVDIAYAGFYRLGRTDKSVPINDSVVNSDWTLEAGTGTNSRARYAVHFHRTGIIADGNPSVVRGSAVVDSPGWGFVNHSSYVDMIDNVAYDVHGAAFSTEVGDEIGSFRNNIAIGSVGSGESTNSRIDIQDFGHQGDGFWFQGGGVYVTDNISAGNDGNAFAYYTRGLIEGGVRQMFRSANLPSPEIANGSEMIDVEQVPIFEFARNTGYASSVGLATRYQLRDALHPLQQSTIRESLFWNNSTGIDLSYSQRIIVSDTTVTNALGTLPKFGIAHNAVTKDIRFENVTVTGYSWGIDVPRLGSTIINGGYFANRYDIVVQPGLSNDRSVLITGAIQLGQLGFENVAHVYMRAQTADGFVLTRDVVTLDYGSYDTRRLYYLLQHPNAVPVPLPIAGVPLQYVGLTNQQLLNLFGVAYGGEIAPADAQSNPKIIGLIAP
jgi:Ca2+-binding RTX toxin-like protein